MLAFFSVEDSGKRAASVDQLKNAHSSILLKKKSLTQSLTDTEKYILFNHHLTLGTDTFFSLEGERKRFLFNNHSFFVISPIKSIPFLKTVEESF